MSFTSDPFVFGQPVVVQDPHRSGDAIATAYASSPSLVREPSAQELESAQKSLAADFNEVAALTLALPEAACPFGLAVAEAVIRRGLLLESHYPRQLFASLGFNVLGSRLYKRLHQPLAGQPDSFHTSDPWTTTSIWVACSKEDLSAASGRISGLEPSAFRQIAFLDSVRFVESREKILTSGVAEIDNFEAVLYIVPGISPDLLCDCLKDYAASVGFERLEACRRIHRKVAFMTFRGPRSGLPELARFTLLRHLSEVGSLRSFKPGPPVGTDAADQGGGDAPPVTAGTPAVPQPTPGKPDPGVAILDAGFHGDGPLSPWISAYFKCDPGQPDVEGGPDHGSAVVSAYLFGPLEPNGQMPSPWSPVTVYRVVDQASAKDQSMVLHQVLLWIEGIISSGKFKFINLSLGPNVPVNDQVLHSWTATIDFLAYTYDVYVAVAVGNNGVGDLNADPAALAAARVEVPSNAAYVVGVGAFSRKNGRWARAYYSALGPGGPQALIKPDLLAFGGVPGQPFYVLPQSSGEGAAKFSQEMGTSFATPSALREAVGLYVLSGGRLSTQAVRAMQIHFADNGGFEAREVGWGRSGKAEDIAALLAAGTFMIYQGEASPGDTILAGVPRPAGGWPELTRIHATLCFSSFASPQDPAECYRTGLEATFRTDVHGQADGTGRDLAFFDLDGGKLDPETDERALKKAVSKTATRSNFLELPGGRLIDPAFVIVRPPEENESLAKHPLRYGLVMGVSVA